MMYRNEDGFVSYHQDELDEHEICISKLYVRPERRGKKAGYRLLDAVKTYCKVHFYKTMGLFVYPFEAKNLIEEHEMTRRLVEYYSAYGFNSNPEEKSLMTYTI